MFANDIFPYFISLFLIGYAMKYNILFLKNDLLIYILKSQEELLASMFISTHH